MDIFTHANPVTAIELFVMTSGYLGHGAEPVRYPLHPRPKYDPFSFEAVKLYREPGSWRSIIYEARNRHGTENFTVEITTIAKFGVFAS